jgi:glucose/mannose transport system permease protein
VPEALTRSKPSVVRASRRAGRWPARVALLPLALTAVVAYLGSMLWSLRVSLSASRTFPSDSWVGAAQYLRLFANERWILSLQNLAVYGLLFMLGCLLLGFLLALLIDRQVAGEGVLRAVFLYPYAMSFIASGAVWAWMLNPTQGIEAVGHALGFGAFRFDWIVDPDRVIYAIVIAAVWQASGLVMALLLAGLRGVDADLWRAARIDGIPTWRVYVSIVVPQLGYSFATATILLLTAVVKLYDAVVAMTQGGPGTASEVPAKFIMDHLYGRANIALASAASIMLLLTAIALVTPFLYARSRAAARGA